MRFNKTAFTRAPIELRRSCFVVLLFFFFVPPVPASAAETVQIGGRILIPEGMTPPPQGYDVVLLKFVLTTEGQVTTQGPQARVKTDPEGNFLFAEVPRELRAAYRVGTRVNGKLHQSDVLFLNAENTHFNVDLAIPGVSENTAAMVTEQATLVLEAGIGRVGITEIWRLRNPTRDHIDSRNNPLLFDLPENYDDFQMIKGTNSEQSEFKIRDGKLELPRIFPSGRSQVLFHYSIPAWFGSAGLSKTFRNSLDRVRVFTPIKGLRISSAQLEYMGDKKLQDATYSNWQGINADSGKLALAINRVPVSSLDYGVVALVTLCALTLCVYIFLRYRFRDRT